MNFLIFINLVKCYEMNVWTLEAAVAHNLGRNLEFLKEMFISNTCYYAART